MTGTPIQSDMGLAGRGVAWRGQAWPFVAGRGTAWRSVARLMTMGIMHTCIGERRGAVRRGASQATFDKLFARVAALRCCRGLDCNGSGRRVCVFHQGALEGWEDFSQGQAIGKTEKS